jgi:hypothetical protein
MSGCDSVVTLDLTITNSTSGTDTQTACDSYTWIDSNTYTSNNNTATHTLVNVGGCDSVVTLDLTINTVDNGITNSSPTLMANAIGSTYQWLDCDNNFQPITGETNQSFTPSANGNYAVEVTENNCVDTSDCETINTVVVIENSFEKILSFYPNPTTSMFTINLDHIYENISINVSTIGGKLVSTHTYKSVMNITFEIEGASEIYIIEVSNHEGKKARLKVFKQ